MKFFTDAERAAIAAAAFAVVLSCGCTDGDITAAFVKQRAGDVTKSTFLDRRDSTTYSAVKIWDQWWMAENLNVVTATTSTDSSWCYENSLDSCAKYGRLYNWQAAVRACPSGWHLPTRSEWDALLRYAGGGSYAGRALKSKSGWSNKGNGTDDFGFSALPNGFRYDGYNDKGVRVGLFGLVGEYGSWWSAAGDGSGKAYYRSMGVGEFDNFDRVDGGESADDGSFTRSVRCVAW